MASVVNKPSPWGKPSWATPASAPAPTTSLRDIQRQEQLDSDEKLARQLQEALMKGDQPAETATATATATTTDVAAQSSVPDTSTDDDMALAMMLQAEFDKEHDQQLTARELRENMFASSKVSVSMNHLRRQPVFERQALEAEDEYESDEDEESLSYDKGTRSFRDASGDIVTKHNAATCGRRNRRKLAGLPLSLELGNMGKTNDVKISNKVFNSLKRFSKRNEKQRARLHEKKEHSTSVLALDAKTRLILYKMVASGQLDEVNGCISSGKEAVVFHGVRRLDPENPDSPKQDVAIKVFKTTITEFKNRAQFLNCDRRYEARVGKQSVRKLVKLWAEKEAANLMRMRRAGLKCPEVVFQRQHVLVMTFLGNDHAAPKLKDVQLSSKKLTACYDAVCDNVRTLYQECQLVHADLSEYNILYHENAPWLIDVGQAVEPTHNASMEYLFRDCTSVTRYFKSVGAPNVRTAEELLTYVTGKSAPELDSEQMARCTDTGRTEIERQDATDLSSVCVNFEIVSSENAELLLEGLDEEALQAESENESFDSSEGELIEAAEVAEAKAAVGPQGPEALVEADDGEFVVLTAVDAQPQST